MHLHTNSCNHEPVINDGSNKRTETGAGDLVLSPWTNLQRERCRFRVRKRWAKWVPTIHVVEQADLECHGCRPRHVSEERLPSQIGSQPASDNLSDPRFGSKSRIQFACVRCLLDMHVSEICRIIRPLNYGFCRKHNIIA